MGSGSGSFLKVLVKNLDVLAGPIVSLAYPLYASVRAIETKSAVDDQQWLTYWVLYSFITLFELTFAPVIEWLPFWSYGKLFFNCWLVLPYFNGAAHVYEHFVRPMIVNQQVVNIWYIPKKDDSGRPDDVISAAQKYIEQNGSKAFETLVNKFKTSNARRSILEEVEAERRAKAERVQDVHQQLSKDMGDLNVSSDNIEREDSCFRHIESQLTDKKQSLFKEKQISINNLQQKICPEKVVVRLAYNRKITLISGPRSRASSISSTKPIVKLENPLEIKNYVQGGQFINIRIVDGKTYSLAWFEGYLHLFLWLLDEEMWELDTSLGDVQQNRKLAIDFLRKTNIPIKIIMKKINEVVKEYKYLKRLGIIGAQPEAKKHISYYNQKCQSFMLDIKSRTAILAEGYLRERF